MSHLKVIKTVSSYAINVVFTVSFTYLMAFLVWLLTSSVSSKVAYEVMTKEPMPYVLCIGFLASILFFARHLHRYLLINSILTKYKCTRPYSRLIFDALAVCSLFFAPLLLLKYQYVIRNTLNPILVLALISFCTYHVSKRLLRINTMVKRIGD